jgi:putative oxidoreductase
LRAAPRLLSSRPSLPRGIDAVTLYLIYAGRFLLGLCFVVAGLRNFTKLDVHAGILDRKRVPLARAVLVAGLVVQTAGGLSVALGLFPAIGALGLIVFTLAASALYHDFWTYAGAERTPHVNAWLTNLALIGGFLLVIALA